MSKDKAEPVLDHFTPGEPGVYTAEEAASKASQGPADAGPSDSEADAPAEVQE